MQPLAAAQEEQAEGNVPKFFLKLSFAQSEEKREIAITNSKITMKAYAMYKIIVPADFFFLKLSSCSDCNILTD